VFELQLQGTFFASGSKSDLNTTIIEMGVEPVIVPGIITRRDIEDPAEHGVPDAVEDCHAIYMRGVHVRFDLHFGPWGARCADEPMKCWPIILERILQA
jgi:hypothetical protein